MSEKTTKSEKKDESSMQFLIPKLAEPESEQHVTTTDKIVVGSLTLLLLVSFVFTLIHALG